MHSSLKLLSIIAVAGLGLMTAAFAHQQDHRFDASLLDADHDGIVSNPELGAHLDQLFARSDTNHNGELDAPELRTFHERMQSVMGSSSTMAHGGEQPMMTTMSRAQFRQVMGGFAAGHDADRDRVLTVNELNAAFQTGSSN